MSNNPSIDPNRADRFVSRPGELKIHRAEGKPPLPSEFNKCPPFLGALRREIGCTQSELAERMGVDQGAVSRLERRRDPKLSTVLDYLAALDAGDVDLTVTLAGGGRVSLPLARQ